MIIKINVSIVMRLKKIIYKVHKKDIRSQMFT